MDSILTKKHTVWQDSTNDTFHKVIPGKPETKCRNEIPIMDTVGHPFTFETLTGEKLCRICFEKEIKESEKGPRPLLTPHPSSMQSFLQMDMETQKNIIHSIVFAPYINLANKHRQDTHFIFGRRLDPFILTFAVDSIDDKGRFYIIRPTIFSAEIINADINQTYETWQYKNATEALVYYGLFVEDYADSNTPTPEEPDGWIRHKPSNRRRTNGDPNTEHIRK